MDKKKLIIGLIIVVVVVLLVVVFGLSGSREVAAPTVSPQPRVGASPTSLEPASAGEAAQDLSTINTELNAIDVGDIEQDFKTIDVDLGTL